MRSTWAPHAAAQSAGPEVTRTVDSAESSALSSNQRAEVLAILGDLPARQREVLVLRYYLDLSESAIADALGVSRGAVKSHASRGISTLRARLSALSQEDQP